MEIGLKPQGADTVRGQNEKRNAVMSQTLGKKTGASMVRGKRHWFKPRLRQRQELKGETLRRRRELKTETARIVVMMRYKIP